MTSSETTFNDAELIARLRDAVSGEHDMTPHGADVLQAADRIEELLNLNEALVELMDDRDAKLEKAVETLKVALRYNNAMHGGAGAYNKRIKDFIAELKGHDDE